MPWKYSNAAEVLLKNSIKFMRKISVKRCFIGLKKDAKKYVGYTYRC